MIDKTVEGAVDRALAAEAKAIDSGDMNDFVAAETAYFDASRIAYAAMSGPSVGRLSADWHRLADLAKDLGKSAGLMKQKARDVHGAAYRARRSRWASRDVMVDGKPPVAIDVLDEHGGFTAVTKNGYGGSPLRGSTLWQSGALLKDGTTGTLQQFDPKSSFQTQDATKAIYKVRGYRYPIAAWFDNKTGTRIA